MGKASRDKGYRAEHEIVLICEREGIPVKRNFMSGMFSDSVDLEINCRPVSVKRRANGMKWAYDDLAKGKFDYILFRADGKKWLKIELWSLTE